MRVDGPRIPELNDRKAVERPKDSPAGAEAGKPSQAVVVAPAAQERAEAAGRAREETSKRLETVKAQLADGTYKVDYDKLSERLVDEELGRLGRASS